MPDPGQRGGVACQPPMRRIVTQHVPLQAPAEEAERASAYQPTGPRCYPTRTLPSGQFSCRTLPSSLTTKSGQIAC